MPSSTSTSSDELGVLSPPPNVPTSGLTERQAREAKNELVIEMPGSESYLSAPDAESEFNFKLDPREGLVVTFTSAVETLKQNLANSILLGVTISILLLLGIDKREERASLTASPA
jgi:hypothetical protein